MDLGFLQNLSVATLFAGFVFGVLGMYLIKRGKNEAHIPHILIGAVMVIYPYFVDSALWLWVIGVGLLFAANRMS